MEVLIYVVLLLVLICWCGLLIPQYRAWKNHCYRTVAICLGTLAVAISSFVLIAIYCDFPAILLNNNYVAARNTEDSVLIIVLGIICPVSHFFCWWYTYERKSWDYIYIDGYTAEELKKIVSPECRKLLKLK